MQSEFKVVYMYVCTCHQAGYFYLKITFNTHVKASFLCITFNLILV